MLTAHNDVSAGMNRLYGYVLNFSREWRGNLVFYGPDGHIEHGGVPAFNALNLFVVPTRHAVTQVASFAARDRLSMVGWVRSNQKSGRRVGTRRGGLTNPPPSGEGNRRNDGGGG